MRSSRKTLIIFGVLFAAGSTSFAPAQEGSDETTRLREALRSTTAQMRALEDQTIELQAQVSEANGRIELLQGEVEAAEAQAEEAEQAYREAVREFNARLEERNETLQQWRDAYSEAADVARTLNAESMQFEGEANAWEDRAEACEAKNIELAEVGRELLMRIEGVTFGDKVLAREPLLGFRRVEMENLFQDYEDRIVEQEVVQ